MQLMTAAVTTFRIHSTENNSHYLTSDQRLSQLSYFQNSDYEQKKTKKTPLRSVEYDVKTGNKNELIGGQKLMLSEERAAGGRNTDVDL